MRKREKYIEVRGTTRSEARDSDREPDSAWKHNAVGMDRLLVKVHQTGVFCC